MADINVNRHGMMVSLQATSATGLAWMAANLAGEWRGDTLWIDAGHVERAVTDHGKDSHVILTHRRFAAEGGCRLIAAPFGPVH